MHTDRSFARHVVSWYAGVHVDQVARIEAIMPEVVRAARLRAGRGTEYGGTYRDTCLGSRPKGAMRGQLSLAEQEGAQCANAS